jgi:hypothetical protein
MYQTSAEHELGQVRSKASERCRERPKQNTAHEQRAPIYAAFVRPNPKANRRQHVDQDHASGRQSSFLP